VSQFLGEYEVPVDEKGRIFIPAELRRKLLPEDGDTLIVVRGLDGCLTAHPLQSWSSISKKIMELPQTDQKVRLFSRGTLSQAAELKLDRQGRVNLPRKLLDRAGIGDRMTVIGALDKLEFWNPEVWRVYMEQAESTLEEVAQSLNL
jgi:MraZ protein